MKATEETKTAFYDDLRLTLRNIPRKRVVYILGDFNARVGRDHDSWPRQIGHHGVGKMNDNGQRVLELCAEFDLCVTNTFFEGNMSKKVSWRHPRSGHWHQIDLVLARRHQLQRVKHTASMHSADCDTGHALVIRWKVQLSKLKKRTIDKNLRRTPKFNTKNMRKPDLVNQFAAKFQDALANAPADTNCNRKCSFL